MRKIALLTFMSRSGSTFLSSLLEQYSDFCVSIETDFINCLCKVPESVFVDVRRTYDMLNKKSLTMNRIISREDFIGLFEGKGELTRQQIVVGVLEHYFSGREAEICVVKARGAVWDMHELASCFPDIRFIHIVRDGRAVMNSQYNAKRVYKSGYMAMEPLSPALMWRKWTRFVDDFGSEHPDRLLEVMFEEIVVKPDAGVQEIYRFLGGSREEATKAESVEGYQNRIPATEKSLHENIGKKPLKTAVNKWRNSLPQADITAFELLAGNALVRKGYAGSDHEDGVPDGKIDFVFLLSFIKFIILFLLQKMDNLKYRILQYLGLWSLDPK